VHEHTEARGSQDAVDLVGQEEMREAAYVVDTSQRGPFAGTCQSIVECLAGFFLLRRAVIGEWELVK
jgi:hypothetical protein